MAVLACKYVTGSALELSTVSANTFMFFEYGTWWTTVESYTSIYVTIVTYLCSSQCLVSTSRKRSTCQLHNSNTDSDPLVLRLH